jgi:hypothetical protein
MEPGTLRTALEEGGPWAHGAGGQNVDASRSPWHESIGSPNRAESLAHLGLPTRRRRMMALQQTSRALSRWLSSDLLRVLVIVVAVVVAMLVLTAIFGIGQPGPSLELTPDPAAGMGLPF